MVVFDLFTTVYEAICDYLSNAVNRSLAADRWIRIDTADTTLVKLRGCGGRHKRNPVAELARSKG
jgi:hypothetical protein